MADTTNPPPFDDNLDPKLKKALDEGINWIKQMLELERDFGMEATIRAVDGLDEEEAKKILFVCLTTYAEDSRKMAWLVENWQAAPMN
jgi:hypothetical protein